MRWQSVLAGKTYEADMISLLQRVGQGVVRVEGDIIERRSRRRKSSQGRRALGVIIRIWQGRVLRIGSV